MKEQINRFLHLIEDAKDRLTGLANDLDANDHHVEWYIGDDGSGEIETSCRIQCTFGRFNSYHCGSYVSANHPFSVAEESIREMHSKWMADNARYEMREQENEIKERLYQDYLKQLKK